MRTNIEIKYCSNLPVGFYLDDLNHAKVVVLEYMSFLILHGSLGIKSEDKEQ